MLIGWDTNNWELAQTNIFLAAKMQRNKRRYSEHRDIIENSDNSFALLS
jgi:hypothetical protein